MRYMSQISDKGLRISHQLNLLFSSRFFNRNTGVITFIIEKYLSFIQLLTV